MNNPNQPVMALATLQSTLPTIVGGQIATADSAVAAREKAMVEARYVMALHRPRNWDQVRQDILKECRRPAFAHNKSTWYRKPIGKGVEGLGIRFVEVALRCMTNVLIETTMTFEDRAKEIHRVSVTDLESNITYPMDVRVDRTVERSKPSEDGSYISVRTNSEGRLSYTVPALEDDLLNKRAAQISKAIRTLGLRIVPGDIQDEAEAIIKKIRSDEAARDPDAERKRIVDGFAQLNVRASDLATYLGHDIGTCSPQELVDLRGLYGAIKDGESTWSAAMEQAEELREERRKTSGKRTPPPPPPSPTPAPTSDTAGSPPADPPVSDKPALPALTPEAFKKKSPGWREQIVTGAMSVNDLIATIATRNNLSDDQRMEIAGWQALAPNKEQAE